MLDGAGEAVVELPGWFGAVNRDCRYQLTCVGGYAPVYVAQKLEGRRTGASSGRAIRRSRGNCRISRSS